MKEVRIESEILNAALAGLLHDIGKIEQRAQTVPRASVPGLESEGQPAHATYSAYFIQNYVPKAYRAAALAGIYHHIPEQSPAEDKHLSKLIALADMLSAGERVDEESVNKKPHPRQMMTIFDRISLKKGRKEKEEKEHRYLPLRPLNLTDSALFPIEVQDKDGKSNGYQLLLDELSAAAKHDPGDMQSYIENILGVMQTTAWCVPSAYYNSAPDVSLYDHSRMTAALAVCMSHLPESEIDRLLESARSAFLGWETLPDTPLALLIGGDISGIQDFIYTITSKEAAKTLRGRSFYLQLLTEAVLRFVLNELGLPYTNVIYSGGGHFFLLAPVSAKDQIVSLRSKITKKMFAHHETNLYFALGYTEVPASGFEGGEFPKFWSKMHSDLAFAKSRRYFELGDDMYKKIFAVPETGGNPETTCSVCGNDALKTKPFTDYDEAQARRCSLCESFSDEIGSRLTESQFVAFGWQEPQTTPVGTLSDALKAFGLQFKLLENKDLTADFPDAHHVTFWALDDVKHGYPKSEKVPAANFLRYTVKDIPKMTFDELQGKVEGGFNRLGVLRMDVDNLGEVFKNGLGQYATLARISTLSFQMSLFFEGWVKSICEEPEFKGIIYAVYAGGDDVFLIGPWDVMPNLALRIRDDFAKYTANHEDLHISAGLAFIGGKYPIYQAAEDAEVILNSAKKNDGKNAFGFIGNVWQWDEFKEVKKKFTEIVRIVSSKEVNGLNGPHAIIQILRELTEMRIKRSEKVKDTKEVWGPWQWRGTYLLMRMEERERKATPELADAIASIRKDLEPNYTALNQWGAAARWAQLKTRKKTVKDDELA